MNEVHKKYLEIIGYLTVSNGLGYLLSQYILGDPALTAIFGPTINFIIYALNKELKEKDGYFSRIKK